MKNILKIVLGIVLGLAIAFSVSFFMDNNKTVDNYKEIPTNLNGDYVVTEKNIKSYKVKIDGEKYIRTANDKSIKYSIMFVTNKTDNYAVLQSEKYTSFHKLKKTDKGFELIEITNGKDSNKVITLERE